MRDISSRFIEALEDVYVRVRLWSVGAGSALYSTLSCLFAYHGLLAALLTETHTLCSLSCGSSTAQSSL